MAIFSWALGFYGQSVYLAELQRAHGWPASLIATATTFFYLSGALQVAFVSDAIKAFGPRLCLTVSVCIMAVATVLLGRITEQWQLFAVYALLSTGWAGTSLGAITTTLGMWFDRKRGMAISLALNGASFGGIIGIPLVVGAIGQFGLEAATEIIAIGGVALLVPLVLLFIRPGPVRHMAANAASDQLSMSGKAIRGRAFRDWPYMTLTAAYSIVLFAQVGMIVHLISYLDPLIGRSVAAFGMSLMTVAAVVGRLLLSALIDRANLRRWSVMSILSQAFALLLMIVSRDPIMLVVACVIFGFSVGNHITMPAVILQHEFDPRAFATLATLLTAINQIVYSFGPAIMGWIRDFAGTYTAAIALCIGLQLIGSALLLKGPKPKSQVVES